MRFVVLYPNQAEVRTQVIQHLHQAANKSFDFTQGRLRTPFFQTFPSWPRIDQLDRLPLWIQVEELEYVNKEFRVLRSLVIDIDAAEMPPTYIQMELNIETA